MRNRFHMWGLAMAFLTATVATATAQPAHVGSAMTPGQCESVSPEQQKLKEKERMDDAVERNDAQNLIRSWAVLNLQLLSRHEMARFEKRRNLALGHASPCIKQAHYIPIVHPLCLANLRNDCESLGQPERDECLLLARIRKNLPIVGEWMKRDFDVAFCEQEISKILALPTPDTCRLLAANPSCPNASFDPIWEKIETQFAHPRPCSLEDHSFDCIFSRVARSNTPLETCFDELMQGQLIATPEFCELLVHRMTHPSQPREPGNATPYKSVCDAIEILRQGKGYEGEVDVLDGIVRVLSAYAKGDIAECHAPGALRDDYICNLVLASKEDECPLSSDIDIRETADISRCIQPIVDFSLINDGTRNSLQTKTYNIWGYQVICSLKLVFTLGDNEYEINPPEFQVAPNEQNVRLDDSPFPPGAQVDPQITCHYLEAMDTITLDSVPEHP